MWAKIAGAVAGVAVTAYVGRKAYVANRTRKEENEALKAKISEGESRLKELDEKIQKTQADIQDADKKIADLQGEVRGLEGSVATGFENINSKLDRLIETPKFDADAIVKMVKDLEEAFSKTEEPVVTTEAAEKPEPEVAEKSEKSEKPAAPVDQIPEAIVSAEEMAELLVPRNAGKRNRKAA